MYKVFVSFVFSLLLIYVQVEAKRSCNDDCLTKTYCISSDGSGVCSKNNLVTAKFEMVSAFGKYDYLQLTLKGYNLTANEDLIKLSFDRLKGTSNEYICYKSFKGVTKARFIRGNLDITDNKVGRNSSNNQIYCFWNFSITDEYWPTFNGKTVDMITDASQSISLYHGLKKVQVSNDTTQLPIYHGQYLKCCNKTYSNDKFLLTFDQINQKIYYKLYYFQDDGNQVTIILTHVNGTTLEFNFDLFKPVEGWIRINDTEKINITGQIENPKVIYREIHSWSTPFVLNYSNLSINASKSVFDLEVQVDGKTIYTAKRVTLKNSSNLFESSVILFFLAVLFRIFIN